MNKYKYDFENVINYDTKQEIIDSLISESCNYRGAVKTLIVNQANFTYNKNMYKALIEHLMKDTLILNK